MFRMSRGSFADLEEELDPFLRRDEMKATASSGSPISTRTRLAVTLRWLAGGSHIDLCFAWGIAHSTFYSERGIFSSLIPLIPSFPFLSPDSESMSFSQLFSFVKKFQKRHFSVHRRFIFMKNL